MGKDKVFVILLGIFCLSIIGVAFYLVGTPDIQKLIRLDEKRLNDFSNIRFEIESFYQRHKKLPEGLSDLNNIAGIKEPLDPETRQLYEYSIVSNINYELCTTFSSNHEEFEKYSSFRLSGFDEKLDFNKGYSCIKFEIPQYILENKEKPLDLETEIKIPRVPSEPIVQGVLPVEN